MTKAKTKGYKFPWDLPPQNDYFLPISRGVAQAMLLGDDSEKAGIDLIASAWDSKPEVKGVKPDFGIYIPRRYGLTGSERLALSNSSAQERERGIRSLELIEKISSETGLPPESVKVQLELVGENKLAEASDVLPYLAQFMELVRDTEPVSEGDRVVTLYMKRAIPEWTDTLTASLHSRIWDMIRDFVFTENSDQDDSDDEKKLLEPSLTLEEN